MTSTRIDRQVFLANLRRSGLLADADYEAAVRPLPATDRGRVVARELVVRGVLTRFQAEMLLAGRTSGFVLGQYRILDQLGRGGMGRVFKAVHLTMDRVIALKVVGATLVNTDKAQRMFQREVRAAARLVHPNIVTAYDANRIGDRHYLVMEFVDGPNLEQLVGEHGPLPIGQACEYIRQAANGLQYALEMGMVHRDIKPSNLLVRRADGVVKILDFGLARLRDPGPEATAGPGTIETRRNVVLGTPDYVAPEQARNLHDADIRSDLYSLGCTFYFLLTAQVPFPDGTPVEKLVRHATEEPMPLERLRPDVPPGVAAIVRNLMARDPAVRFQTPARLAAALAPFAAAEPTGWTVPSAPFNDDLGTPHEDAGHTPAGTPPGPAGDGGSTAPPAAEDDSIFAANAVPDLPASRLSSASLPPTGLLHPGWRMPWWVAALAALAITGMLVALGYWIAN